MTYDTGFNNQFRNGINYGYNQRNDDILRNIYDEIEKMKVYLMQNIKETEMKLRNEQLENFNSLCNRML